MTLSLTWVLRSPNPATQPPNPDYPYGIALDMTKSAQRACSTQLPYPAPGVGTWFVICDICGLSVGVTAAGRADDPTQVKVACK